LCVKINILKVYTYIRCTAVTKKPPGSVHNFRPLAACSGGGRDTHTSVSLAS